MGQITETMEIQRKERKEERRRETEKERRERRQAGDREGREGGSRRDREICFAKARTGREFALPFERLQREEQRGEEEDGSIPHRRNSRKACSGALSEQSEGSRGKQTWLHNLGHSWGGL